MLKPTPLVKQAAANDVGKPSLRALFDAEETPLLRYAFSLTGRRAVAEEIVQEVFMQLHSHWDEVDAPQAWLRRSVRNKAFNYMRDNKREVLGIEGDSQSRSSQEVTPEEGMLRMEATAELREKIEELDETDRLLVKLKYFEDLKYREISARTGLSISNVGYRLHHILKELATKLNPLGVDNIS